MSTVFSGVSSSSFSPSSGDGSNQLVQNEFSLGRRTFNGTTSIQWKIGANVYPSQPVLGSQRNPSQYIAELIKSLASLGDIRQGSMINRQNFTGYTNAAIQGIANTSGNPIGGNTDIAANRNGTPSLGFFGIDLETYSQSSDILESGIDTSSLSLPINVEFVFGADTRAAGVGGAAGAAGTALGAGTFNGTILVNSYCLIDCIYSLDSQGLLTCAM